VANVVHIINVDIGITIHLRNQLLYLQERGYNVTAVCGPGRYIQSDGLSPHGIPVKVIPFSQRIAPVKELITLAQLIHYLRHEPVDIIHTHSIQPGMWGRLAAQITQIPIIMHTLHGFYFHDEMPPQQQRFWKFMEKLGMSLGEYTLSQNHEDIHTAIQEGITRPEKIGYLGNGIEVAQFDPSNFSDAARQMKREELGIKPNETVIAISGRMVPEKGHKEFLEAATLIAQRYPDARFWVMGAEQPRRNAVFPISLWQNDVLRDKITFLGMRDDMPKLYAALDIFTLPSHGREGVPRVLMEASTMAKPIVTTQVRGCREAIIHGKTGLMVPPYNPVALAKAIMHYIEQPDYARRLADAARQYALENFDERIYFARLEDTYQMLLERHNMQNRIPARARSSR